MPIDDSVVENARRRVTVGGENDLHLGSDHGGRTMSVVYAFTGSCAHFAIHPVACLQKVLRRLPSDPAEQLVDRPPYQEVSRYAVAHLLLQPIADQAAPP
jgi:hypothetical protein